MCRSGRAARTNLTSAASYPLLFRCPTRHRGPLPRAAKPVHHRRPPDPVHPARGRTQLQGQLPAGAPGRPPAAERGRAFGCSGPAHHSAPPDGIDLLAAPPPAMPAVPGNAPPNPIQANAPPKPLTIPCAPPSRPWRRSRASSWWTSHTTSSTHQRPSWARSWRRCRRSRWGAPARAWGASCGAGGGGGGRRGRRQASGCPWRGAGACGPEARPWIAVGMVRPPRACIEASSQGKRVHPHKGAGRPHRRHPPMADAHPARDNPQRPPAMRPGRNQGHRSEVGGRPLRQARGKTSAERPRETLLRPCFPALVPAIPCAHVPGDTSPLPQQNRKSLVLSDNAAVTGPIDACFTSSEVGARPAAHAHAHNVCARDASATHISRSMHSCTHA